MGDTVIFNTITSFINRYVISHLATPKSIGTQYTIGSGGRGRQVIASDNVINSAKSSLADKLADLPDGTITGKFILYGTGEDIYPTRWYIILSSPIDFTATITDGTVNVEVDSFNIFIGTNITSNNEVITSSQLMDTIIMEIDQ